MSEPPPAGTPRHVAQVEHQGRRRWGRDAGEVANVTVVVVVLLVVCSFIYLLRRHGDGIIARRGMSVGADLGTLADAPRVRIRAVTKEGPDRIRLVLAPETDPGDSTGVVTKSDLNFVVGLEEEEFGFGVLHQWHQAASVLALVIPPGSRLVRLRSLGDLQHLTLRCVDEG
jgi:hypothetical protein